MTDASPKRPLPSTPLLDKEAQRLAALRRYNVLDTPSEAAFDRVTSLAAQLFKVPMALIVLVDEARAWFKSCYGFDLKTVQWESEMGAFALLLEDVLVVPDTRHDDRFAGKLFTQSEPELRFYAGTPLLTEEGYNLGTLCLLDTQPGESLTTAQQGILLDLAAIVIDELELRLAACKVAEIDQALFKVNQGVAATTGTDFFTALVKHFTQALGVDYAYIAQVTEADDARMTTLAMCAHGEMLDNFDYSLRDTPCGEVLRRRELCCYPQGVQTQFTQSMQLVTLKIESYAAIPFFDGQGTPLGVFGILDSKPLENVPLVETLLSIFALRIATELERQQTEIARHQVQQQLEELVAQRTAELSQTNHRLQLEIAERQQTELILQQEQEMLRILLDNVQAGIAACDRDGKLTLFNQTARDFHGLPEYPLSPQQWTEFYNLYRADGKTPLPLSEIPLYRALQGETIDSMEMVIAPHDRVVRTVIASGQAMVDAQGNRKGAVVVMHDITAQKQIEMALREREAQLSSIFQTIPNGIVMLNPQGEIITANAAAEEIFGLTHRDLTQRVYNDAHWSLTTVEGQPLSAEDLPFAQVMRTRKPVYGFELGFLHADGSRRLLSINTSPLLDDEGNVIHVLGAISDITERKQAEATLRASEERYRSVIETVAEGIVLQHADGSIFTCNASAEKILGLTTDEMTGLTSLDPRWATIYEDGTPFPGEQHPSMITLRTGEPQTNVVMGLYKPDHTLTWISINTRPLFQPDDPQPFAVVASFFDITARKQAETERAQLIQEQTARLEAEMEQQRSAFLVEISAVLASSLNCNYILEGVANQVVPFFADWCVIDLVHHANQTIERVAIAHIDPERVQLAWELHNRYPLRLEDTVGLPKTLQAGKTKIAFDISDAALQTIAHDDEHLDRLRALGLKSCIVSPLIVRGQILGVISFITAESKRRYEPTDLALAENIAHQVAIAIDNARLYHAEQMARNEAEAASRIKDEFLAVLSHELRSPLNPILGWAKLLRTRQLDAEKTKRALEVIERNAQIQAQLIEDLLDVARILRGKLSLNLTTVDLKATVEAALETVRLAAEAKAITLQLKPVESSPNSDDPGADSSSSPSTFQVPGDPARLQQIVWNLLSNAVKFTPQGGQVNIGLERITRESSPACPQEGPAIATLFPATAASGPPHAYVQITVTDTGKGITPEFLPYIFDRFRQADSKTTRKFGGLGLGLAIVRQLVELHGGTIHVDSPGEDQGSTFTVRLPLSKASRNRPSRRRALKTPPAQPLLDVRILVVDDEIDARDLVVFVLEQAGANVTSVASAVEALQVLKQTTIDVLISDIGMPDMDGYMLMQQVQAQFAETPNQPVAPTCPMPKAIALTAYAGELNQRHALAVGFQRHLSKPVEPSELVTAIANLVE